MTKLENYDIIYIVDKVKECKDMRCSVCGCPFISDYEDGNRICLYCGFKWHIDDSIEVLKQKQDILKSERF